MKRKLTVLAVLLALALTLTSCAAGSGWKGEDLDADFAPSEDSYDVPESPPDEKGDYSDDWSGESEGLDVVAPQTGLAEKLIYSAEITLETVKFDDTVQGVQDMLARYGAFLESSRVSGRSYGDDYYGRTSLRRAEFVIRVPAESLNDLCDGVGGIGNVLNSYTYMENITERYYDVQARADSYRIEQERLMDMLEKCQSVGEMIEIESRLSQVRYEMESLESTLRNWQNQVDYSTVTLTVREVEELKKATEPYRSYWQQMGDGFMATLNSVGRFFKNLFQGLVVYLPVILVTVVLVGAAAAAIAALAKRHRRKVKAREEAALDAEYQEKE